MPAGSSQADAAAALLYCGKGSVLQKQISLAVWGLGPAPREIEVATPRHIRGTGFVKPRRQEVPANEVVRRDGLPVTFIPRTLADIPQPIEVLLHEALARRLTTHTQITAYLAAHPRRRGNTKLRKALQLPHTRSPHERLLLKRLQQERLPLPIANERRHGTYWPQFKLVIELDGLGHRSPHQRRIDEPMDDAS